MITNKITIKALEKVLLLFLLVQIAFTFIQNPLSKIFIITNLIYTLIGFAIIFILNYAYLKTKNSLILPIRYLILFLVVIFNILQTNSNLFLVLFIVLATDIILEQKRAKKIGIYLSSILVLYIAILAIYNFGLIYTMRDTNINIAILYLLLFVISVYNNHYLDKIHNINNKISNREEIKNNEKKFIKTINRDIRFNLDKIENMIKDDSLLYCVYKNKEYIFNITTQRLAQKGLLDMKIDTISLNQEFRDTILAFRRYDKKLNIDFKTNIANELYILIDTNLLDNIINMILVFVKENNLNNIHINLQSIPDFVQIQISFDDKITTYLKDENLSQIQNKISWIQLFAVYATNLGGSYNIKLNGIDLNFVKSLKQ